MTNVFQQSKQGHLVEVEAEFSIEALALVALARARYDTKAPVRGWAQEYIGVGITDNQGDQHIVSTKDFFLENGEQVMCVVLQINRGAFSGGDKRDTYYFPFNYLDRVTVTFTSIVAGAEETLAR